MNTEEEMPEVIKFRNVIQELKIPENYYALPASTENTIEFIVETY